ncbi:copper chaperone PCu(A)C [Pseudonocardia sp. K10HN5]|uniref:Copper chaperone PCu(A)C n=1 Tax=Pseudonocardia acidicola TaxID=2724939 RepID=A0ABX1S6U0_9PSEU|nr:copper chaperone PCu(A)C [Pseudonocardia acidicola]
MRRASPTAGSASPQPGQHRRLPHGAQRRHRAGRPHRGPHQAADTAELHTNQPGAPGAEVMVSIPRLEIPAGATVALRTGGPHIMLMQPHPQVQPGRRIAVELDVDRAGPVTVQLPVLARDQEPTAAGTTGPGMPGYRECDERGRHPTAQPSADPARLPRP